ncbi:D-2-hydroxyacid dehydrogenase [Thiothrix nivea]|uniref:D-isomer specific 2-hydroxyacid dehydrogenase NAD-binding n=1 Tax=Thiothrix nivea (strain ATCC 35100 / DSM 5205 / JP2) TaxID=870187 RepID=A0A656HKK6_THINJ|nr:D-2-hydroxyacid dehydrogenase [Thiothrix nivea]EIJ36634.1 D-isomer specific 2-hydroxyacid dehydrogenase NAD-binding [Thiothrix nivea DSM 5205]
MHKAVFLDIGSTSRDDLDLRRLQTACGALRTCPQTHPGERLHNIGDADIVISNKVVLDAPLLRALAGQAKLVCVAATGTNNVDLKTAQELGIPVTNIRDYATRSVAEHVMALIFALRRQLPAWQSALQRGDWQRSQHFCLLDYPMGEIAGSTLAIFGYGVLGKAVAQLAQAVGMNVIVAEHPNQPAREGRLPFEEALAQADILSLHCPLTPETRSLINTERLQLLKPDCILINTARGGIVDEKALLQALQTGRLGGAGIDVLAEEPPGADSPLLRISLPNLIVTPHVAWASRKARQTLIDQLADIIISWQQGGLMNRVV